jgi:hypothetical protein
MLRASSWQALLVLASLALAASTRAAPSATFKAIPRPIPGFQRTGNILGAGAEVEVQVTITGTEYGGSPSPLTGAAFYSPAGVKVSPVGFATCAPSVLEASGATGCPSSSHAGPTGRGLGVVTFGNERVNETVSIQPFFAPAGGLTFYTEGNTPSLFQIVEKARWLTANPPYGPELIIDVPLVETVPGGNDASILSFRVMVGAAYRRGKRTVSYFTLPRKCPHGGLLLKTELTFMSGETVTVRNKQPCPRRR